MDIWKETEREAEVGITGCESRIPRIGFSLTGPFLSCSVSFGMSILFTAL